MQRSVLFGSQPQNQLYEKKNLANQLSPFCGASWIFIRRLYERQNNPDLSNQYACI